MRIAHVTFSFWPIRGGADAYLAELWRAFHEAGHEQTVFQAKVEGPAPPPGPALDLVEWPAPGSLSPGRRFWYLSAQVARHRDVLQGYDRVIAHYPNYALPLLGHPGLVGLSHGVTWDCGRSAGNGLKKTIAAAAFRSARRYVANDTFFLREMGLPVRPGAAQWREAAPGRWYVPNGVDTERFRPDPEVRAEPVILLARNFYRNRGIHLGIEAFAQIAGDWPDHRLRIAGDRGDEGYREECETLAAKLGVAGRAEFVGPVPWAAMPDEYRKAQVSLIPSLCGEGTSLSALESMACGTPVVATAAGGLPDLPCVHAEASPESLAAAMDRALRERETLALRQRDAVAGGFRLELWACAWRRVIEERNGPADR